MINATSVLYLTINNITPTAKFETLNNTSDANFQVVGSSLLLKKLLSSPKNDRSNK